MLLRELFCGLEKGFLVGLVNPYFMQKKPILKLQNSKCSFGILK
jgi:hypothetical protein